MNNLKWLFQPIMAFALALLVIINLLLVVFWYKPLTQSLSASNNQLGESLARTLSFETASLLHKNDRLGISQVLNRYADEPAVFLAAIDSQEADIRLTSRDKNQTVAIEKYRFPIHFGDELMGHADIELNINDTASWHQQAVTSWLLFNIIGIGAISGFLYWRYRQAIAAWSPLKTQLDAQLPQISQQLTGRPDQQVSQLIQLLSDPMSQHGQLMKHLQTDSASDDTERLLEQVSLVTEEGMYQDVALLSIDCQNWDALIRIYNAQQLQRIWRQYESLMIRVSELYNGVLLPDGFSIVFGLGESETFAFDSVCAARVLQLAIEIIAQETEQERPLFGIAVSAGPAFVSKTYKHGIPLPLVTGDADLWLQQVKALQPINHILMAEPILQDDDVNQQIEANLWRDVTLRNGQRLEIWEFERFKEKDDLFEIQAQTLIKTNS
ncbi:hypothetical protein QWZ13_15940 [Reinekea marina]|uniref:Guanylate cyclase domain-containing protein n=1 Tax=Reinekea marina TaxID=1310421 RepID=A0ABV7WR74_9GAMM|nr:hypothetical protein [Reinekea marina]MDN3650399.1 hypothetical protein [Reinekea marina]